MFGTAGRPCCVKSYLVTVTADAVTEQVKLGFQDGLRCNAIKGQHFLQFLAFCIENVRQSGLL